MPRLLLSSLGLASLIAASASVVPIAAPPGQPARLTADEVARRIQDRDTGRDSRVTMRMKLADRRGRIRERVLDVSVLRGRQAPGAAPAAPDGDRRLIRF